MPDSSDSNGWRPIETAPTDGTFVLLWPGNGWANHRAPTAGHRAPSLMDGKSKWWDDEGQEISPTHWQPLPPPPEPQR